MDLTIPMYQTFAVRTAIAPPLYYVVPREWQRVIDVIEAHGLVNERLETTREIEVETYRFINVRWPVVPFEGRHRPRSDVEGIVESKKFSAGSMVVPLAQPLARVAINLLEPQAPDLFVRWSFFNAIFEQKEYGEPYVVETLAREMLEKDSALQKEFENLLSVDSEFAASPSRRLEFFYRRSPYWDPQMNLYPVGRVTGRLD